MKKKTLQRQIERGDFGCFERAFGVSEYGRNFGSHHLLGAYFVYHRFPGVILYIIMAFIMPDKSEVGFEDYKVE
jgi:hypothetical protein